MHDLELVVYSSKLGEPYEIVARGQCVDGELSFGSSASLPSELTAKFKEVLGADHPNTEGVYGYQVGDVHYRIVFAPKNVRVGEVHDPDPDPDL